MSEVSTWDGRQILKDHACTVEYHATNGDTYTRITIYYQVQEALHDCSREAYENGTEMAFIVIY